MSEEVCGAEGWNDGNEFWCDMREGHGGPHIDTYQGWEWPK